MTDYFSLLNVPRRPWLDPEEINRIFLNRSATVHPDRVHSSDQSERAKAHESYVALNAAQNCLRDPRMRLRHLLELESGALPKNLQQIPPDLMDFSLRVGQLCNAADRLLVEKSQTRSPLLLVQLFERAQQLTDEIQTLQKVIASRNQTLDADLKKLDEEWIRDSDPNLPDRNELLHRLEALYHLFVYFGRWNSQLRERVARLSF